MGTRAIISFVDPSGITVKKLWHQDSGGPDGIGKDLQYLVEKLNAGWNWGYYGDSIDCLADWIQYRGLPTKGGVDHSYHEIGLDEHWGGVEYYYSIGVVGNSWFLHCSDSQGNSLNLKRQNPDVSFEDRRYEIRKVIDHDQYKSMNPWREDIEYGDTTFFRGEDRSYRAQRVYDKKGKPKKSWIKPGSPADRLLSRRSAKKRD